MSAKHAHPTHNVKPSATARSTACPIRDMTTRTTSSKEALAWNVYPSLTAWEVPKAKYATRPIPIATVRTQSVTLISGACLETTQGLSVIPPLACAPTSVRAAALPTATI